ncbi:MAG: hypothetical protein KY475_16750 [Planctomycetes bacterium]|nr:hypothetical protein [Planctomycetota bacterium]
MTALRLPESCRFRDDVARSGGCETAECRLLAELIGSTSPATCRVARDACEACCRAPVSPDVHRLNEVIASLILGASSDASNMERGLPQREALSDELRRRACDALQVAPADHGQMQQFIDRSVTVETLTRRLTDRIPFTYLRYGDGEWLSVLGVEGRNCDRHDFFPESLGPELRQVLCQIAELPPDAPSVYVGTTCDLQERVQPFLSVHRLRDRLHWVSDALFRMGLVNLTTRGFLEAVIAFQGAKLLVGNEFLRPAAHGLGCTHVVIPLENCYSRIDWMERACRFDGPGLVICCASMASECLLWRLRRRNPEATYVDCGSIFDGMLGHMIRRELAEASEMLRRCYAPLFKPFL